MTYVKYLILPQSIVILILLTALSFQAFSNENTQTGSSPDTFTNQIGMTFVRIPPGQFNMGSPLDETGRHNTERRHPVRLDSELFFQTTEVTQAQWMTIMPVNPSGFKGQNLPVEQVSWKDVQLFIKKLNQMDHGATHRLPTEAEWEYAARADTSTAYYFGEQPEQLETYAWYRKNSDGRTHPVARKKANAWGLFDMHGNVWEWVQDWYDDYNIHQEIDPKGPDSGRIKVRRGGGWMSTKFSCRSAARSGNEIDYTVFSLGFRLVCIPG